MKLRLTAVAAVLALGAFAQEAGVAGPSMGLVTETGGRSVRHVEGVPSAALLSEPLEAAGALAWVEAAPGRSYALGVEPESGLVMLITAAARTALEAAEPGALGVRFSPGGSAAALLYNDHALVFGGLPDHRSEPWRLALPEGAGLALSDDGREAIVIQDGQWLRLHADGASSVQPAAGSGPAFLEGSNHILAAAGAAVVELNSEGERRWEVPEGAGPVLAVSGSATHVVAALDGGELAVWERASGTVRRISCGCEPKLLARIGRGGLYRLNDAGDGPVWLLDAASEQPRVLFIPGAQRGEQ